MNKSITAVFFLLALFFAGCSSEPTIDGSSEEAMKASIQKVKATLSDEDKERFEKAAMLLAFDGVNMLQLGADKDGVTRRMRDRLNGKTAQEVIAAAEALRQGRKEKESQQAIIEIAELEAKMKAAEEAKKSLAAFEVKRSRFYFNESRFSSDPIIELTVKNGMKRAVARAYFHGVLATPGREVPWVEDDFNHSISGGLEPGEEATWNLSPNMFGEWGRAPKDRKDMVLTVTVTRLDGADGEPLFDADISDYDRERLKELKSKIR